MNNRDIDFGHHAPDERDLARGVHYACAASNRRLQEHKHSMGVGFTARYNVKRLALAEHHMDVKGAIDREKQVKRWSRVRKAALIEAANRDWKDLCAAWE